MTVLKDFDFIGTDRNFRFKRGSLISITVTFYEKDVVPLTPKDVTGRTFLAKIIDGNLAVVQTFTTDASDAVNGKITINLDTAANDVPIGRYFWEWWDVSSNVFIVGGKVESIIKRYS